MTGEISPCIRLDMDVMCELYENAIKEKELRERITFYTNSTTYKTFNQWRYVEYQSNTQAAHVHNLVSIEDNIILSKVLQTARSATSFEKLKKLISNLGVSENEANEYMHTLIDSQILIPSIYPNLTGESFQKILLSRLSDIGYKKYEKIQSFVNTKDHSNKPISQIISDVSNSLQEFNISKKSSNTIQADLLKHTTDCTIDDQLKETLKEITQLLSGIMIKSYEPNNLNEFKKAFYERYEGKFMPLTTALDPDIGIGFKNVLTKNKSQINLSEGERKISSYKLNILVKSIESGRKPYEISRKEIENLSPKEKRIQPCSYAIMANLYLNRSGKSNVRFKNGGGSSALNLLGRFAYMNSHLENICKDIALQEEDFYDDKVLAEVVHFPQGRIGNVLIRPHFYQYEIPYLGISTLPEERQITVDDLLVGLRNDRVTLYSKRLKKEILPRLSTAHNFRFDSLPIYQFLSELQSQDEILGCYWSWDELSQQDFLPRITYKDVVISPAKWNIDTAIIQRTDTTDLLNQLNIVGIPTKFLVCQGDNEMYIDVENELSRKTFFSLCKKTTRLLIEENLFNNDNSPDGYTNEVCIPIIQSTNQRKHSTIYNPNHKSITPSKFTPFSNCIYLKLYAGSKWAEKILIDTAPSLIKDLRKRKIIDKWFFIRYNDPQSHLRVRFFIRDGNYGKAIEIIGKKLKKYTQHDLIWDTQIGTYQRELDRYGHSTMEDCEDYFCYDSDLVLKILPIVKMLTDNYKIATVIFYMDTLFKKFYLTEGEMTSICKSQLYAFGKEFNLDENKQFRSKLSSEYRSQSSILENIFTQGDLPDKSLSICITSIEQSFQKTKTIVSCIIKKIRSDSNAKSKIISSLIHMFINRLFDNDQRYKELVVYYMISKYYDSNKARKSYAEE